MLLLHLFFAGKEFGVTVKLFFLHGCSAELMSDRSESPLSKRRLTICIVGSGGVGKSSLTVRYLQGTFPEVRTKHCFSTYIAS